MEKADFCNSLLLRLYTASIFKLAPHIGYAVLLVDIRIYFTDWTVHIIVAIVLPSLLICLMMYFWWRRRTNARNKKLKTNQFPLEEQIALQEMEDENNPERHVETIMANDSNEVYG